MGAAIDVGVVMGAPPLKYGYWHAIGARPGLSASRALLLVCMMTIFAPEARAQLSTVAGTVADTSGVPIPGVSVVLDDLSGTRTGMSSGLDGSFSFGRLRPGTYTLLASHVGYVPVCDTVRVEFNQYHERTLVLTPETTELGVVTVEAEREEAAEARTSRYSIRPAELARLPVPGLSPDLMGHLQTIPGIMRIADTGGQLSVRGGTPTQNLVLVDGMPLYQPFHIIGFYSAIPADIVSNVDVFAGGFGARYGGRISSVMDVTTRNGSKRGVAASVSLASFLSAALLEIPVRRDEVSILLSVRESVIERIGPAVADHAFPFRFGDYFGKFHAFLSQTSSFSATAIRTYDRGAFEPPGGARRTVRWRNEAYGGRYVFLPPSYPMISQFAIYVSRYDSDFEGSAGSRSSEVTGINGDISFTYLLGPNEVDFGIFARSNSFDYHLGRAPGGSDRSYVSEGGTYLDFHWGVSPRFLTRSGLRVTAFSNEVNASIEPRGEIQWRPGGRSGRTVLGAAAGIYRQQIVGLTALEDLSDAFIAWTPTRGRQQIPRSIHAIVSVYRSIGPRTTLRAEGYGKWMTNLASPRYDRLTEELLRLDALEGRARGVDVQIRHAGSRFYAAAGYALSSVRYTGFVDWPPGAPDVVPTEISFSPPHHRVHQISLSSAVTSGPMAYRLLWQFGSGRPFTQIHGFYRHIPVDEIDRRYHTLTGSPAVAYASEPFGGRTPVYHRLDLSADRRLTAGATEVVIQLGLVNAYDRRNLFDYDVLTGERVDQLPVIPYAALRVNVR